MLRFCYNEYVFEKDGDTLITFEPTAITYGVITGTYRIELGWGNIHTEERTFEIKDDAERDEQYIEWNGNRKYAMDYFSPSVGVYINL